MNEGINLNEGMDFVRQALTLPETAELRMDPINKGGSMRSYFRVYVSNENRTFRLPEKGGPMAASSASLAGDSKVARERRTVIFMHYDQSREENAYHAAIAGFLAGLGVRTPHILDHDPVKGMIVMEDMGDEDLWSFRGAPWPVRRRYYLQTLEMIGRLHSFPLTTFPAQKVPFMGGFTPALYRWERNYFLDNFVEAVCHINLDVPTRQALEKEWAVLDVKLEKQGQCLIHRDLQSHNVMIFSGEPALIDFQGMRTGSPFYDLGSLLYDPYVLFDDEERLDLLAFYHRLTQRGQDWEDFQEMFRLTSAQRLMQALGAYGYLGLKMEKEGFLDHIDNGLNNLADAAARSRCLPQLESLCMGCKGSLTEGY